MKQTIFAAALVVTLGATFGAAGAAPRTVVYSGDPVPLTCGVGYTCTVSFPEPIVRAWTYGGCGAAAGAADQGPSPVAGSTPSCMWKIDAAPAEAGVPTVVVTPLFDHLHTDVVVATVRQNYMVHVDSSASAREASVNVVTRRVDPTTGLAVGGVPAMPRAESQAEVQANDAAVVARVAAQDRPQPVFQAWDLDYWVEGASDLCPLWAANDGRTTILAMPAGIGLVTPAPTVFEVQDGIHEVSAPAILDRIWLLNAIPSTIELSIGDGKSKRMAVVHRGRGSNKCKPA